MQKDHKHRLKALVSEDFEYDISLNKDIMILITAISNEVHRFTLTFNKLLRKKRYTHSELDLIPGIGPTRKKILFEKFGSIDQIKNSEMEQLENTKGIDKKTAKAIYQFFHHKN
jgi:excinuclease ABC subunit C